MSGVDARAVHDPMTPVTPPAAVPPEAHERTVLWGVVWAGLFVLLTVPAVTLALETARHFTGSAIDGPFQLYNALRRIAAGGRPGIDFQFFHGVGVPYAYYWLFHLLGGRFQDSELARELLSTLLLPLTLVVFLRGLGARWVQVFCLAAAAMAAAYLLRLAAVLFALNSMVGLRSTLPVLIPLALYRAPAGRVRAVVVGAMLGLALFVSTEQGIAACVAFVLVAALAMVRTPTARRYGIEAAATVVIALGVLVLALALVGGPRGAAGALRYNFVLVPRDQYWFFGAPPNPFIDSWGDGARALGHNPMIGLAMVLAAVASIGYASRLWVSRGTDRRAWALGFLTLFGLISCGSLLGVFVPVYTQSCWRALIFACIAEMSFRGRDSLTAVRWLGVRRPVAVASGGLCLLTLLVNPQLLGEWFLAIPQMIAHPAATLRFTPAPIWPATLAEDDSIIAAHRRADGRAPLIWSTYSGWAEARNGTFNPSFDYIIHALGPENRRAYVETFDRTAPDLVQTVSPLYTPYEAWIENTNWDFYHALLRRYAVVGATPWSVFWAPRTTTPVPPVLDTTIAVAPGQTRIDLPTVPAEGGWPVTLLEVDLRYTTHNPLRAVPIIGPTPRYLVMMRGALTGLPVTLDPYVGSMRFPVFARPGARVSLEVAVSSLFSPATITLTAARVSSVPLDPRDESWLRASVAAAGF